MIRLLPKRVVSAAALILLLAVTRENGIKLEAATITISLNDFNPTAMQNILDTQAQDGDFIQLPNTSSQPGGKVTWAGVGNLDTDGVIIHKALTISGTSSNRNNGTVIENDRWRDNGSKPSLFQIDSSVTGLVRIRNIYFTSTARCDAGTCDHLGPPPTCYCNNSAINSFASTPDPGTGFPRRVRIDHCFFEKFDFAIMTDCMFGVVDHCSFLDNHVVLRTAGYTKTTFGTGRVITDPLPWDWDSTNTWCMEDCHITVDPVTDHLWDKYLGDTDFPAAYTVRNCVFDITRSYPDNSAGVYDGWDMHGDAGDHTMVTLVGMQIYSNTFNYWASYGASFKLADIRGGYGSLVYSNIVNNLNYLNFNLVPYCYVRSEPNGPCGNTKAANTYLWKNYARAGSAQSLIPVDNMFDNQCDRDDGCDPHNYPCLGMNYFLDEPSSFKQLQYPHALTVGKISAGLLHSLALTSDGRVLAWGDNSYGQLGIGNNNDSSTPVLIPTLHDIVAISAGWTHSLALQSDGTVWAWGRNNCGQLGINSTVDKNFPQQVHIVSGAKYIAAGAYHSLARTSGDFLAWGYNVDGELGDGSPTQRNEPVSVWHTSGLWYYNITAIGAGAYHSFAVDSGGQVWAWGANGRGQLGTGSASPSSINTPQQIVAGGGNGIKSVCGGLYHSLALDANGYVWAWGDNTYGQLGNGTTGGYNATATLYWYTQGGSPNYGVQSVAAGVAHSLAVDRSGYVWSWGYNDKGQLGNNSLNISSSPVQASGLSGRTTVSGGGHFSLSGGNPTAIYSWGANSDGQLGLGNGNVTDSKIPVIVVDGQGGNFQF